MDQLAGTVCIAKQKHQGQQIAFAFRPYRHGIHMGRGQNEVQICANRLGPADLRVGAIKRPEAEAKAKRFWFINF